LQVEQLEERWCPSFTLVTSRTALAGTDSVNWGTLVPTPPPSGIYVANPFTVLSTAGRSISVSKTIADSFLVTQQVSAPPYQGNGVWNGNFAVGDWVLDTSDNGGRTNPITLNFGATAVAAGGAQIDVDIAGGSSINFTAEVDAYDANGNTLASFTEKGTASDAGDNSAIFIGISSSSANISKLALSIKDISKFDKGAFAINKFDFRTSALAAVTAAAVPAVGQPASPLDLAPLASGLLGVGQPALPAAPVPGPATPSAPPASPSGVLPAAARSSPAHSGAADAVFAATGAAANDGRLGSWRLGHRLVWMGCDLDR